MTQKERKHEVTKNY